MLTAPDISDVLSDSDVYGEAAALAFSTFLRVIEFTFYFKTAN